MYIRLLVLRYHISTGTDIAMSYISDDK